MADLVRKILLGSDSRGGRGTFTRGAPVYRASGMAPHTGKKTQQAKLAEAANRRIKGARK
jgi:hypothetical protein